MQRTEFHKLLDSLPDSDVEVLMSAASSDSRFRREMRVTSVLPIVLLLLVSLLGAAFISHYSPAPLVRLLVFPLPILCFFLSLRLMFSINEWNLRRSVMRQLAIKRNRSGL